MENQKKFLLKIYEDLFEMYGSQGWWPVTPLCGCSGDIPDKPIYGIKGLNDKQRLEIIFGAILTQNTQWSPNVEKAITELNKKDMIGIKKIIAVNHDILANIIKSSGFFNQKADRLKDIAEFLRNNSLSKLKGMDLWQARELLLVIKGIGKETADSILLYALEKPIFVVDAYTRRIFSNLKLIKIDDNYDKIQKMFMDNLDNEVKLFGEYHALLVKHGKRFYQKKYDNSKCPLLRKYAGNLSL